MFKIRTRRLEETLRRTKMFVIIKVCPEKFSFRTFKIKNRGLTKSQ